MEQYEKILKYQEDLCTGGVIPCYWNGSTTLLMGLKKLPDKLKLMGKIFW